VRISTCCAIVFSVLLGGALVHHPLATTACAQEDWKSEFDNICSKTTDSLPRTKADIKVLIERCDKLGPRIEKLDETTAKVYLKRLRMCRDLYGFLLESSFP